MTEFSDLCRNPGAEPTTTILLPTNFHWSHWALFSSHISNCFESEVVSSRIIQ